jgi:glutamate/tyrosine decarboxylase-like PLP-dependent enzyme
MITGRQETFVDHPLAMDPETMRRAGYATVDALVARLADPGADPVLRRGQAPDLQARLGGSAPEQPADYAAVLSRVLVDVLPHGARSDHPGYLAFIPSFTTWPAALAELTAAAANPYCGAWLESAGAAQVELEVIDWFRGWLGLPGSTAGVLVTGGSAANLTALLVARDAAGGPSPASVLYVSDQAHSSLARTARAMGLRSEQVRVLPTDDRWRLRPDAVAAAIQADRAAGRVPFALCASAGSTNTGAVDPLAGLADVCAAEGLWLHVDAAYGGFAALTERGRRTLSGIERADSVTLDPHKWLYQPMECGCVLIRDGARLEETFAIHPDYLDGDATQEPGEVNFADRGLQLSRGFRALKVWVSVQTFGLAAFRACVQRNLDLASYAEELARAAPGLRLTAPATLGIICFRREWPDCDEAETERRGIALAAELERAGTALVSTTRLGGRHAIRLCVLNPTTGPDQVRAVIEHFATAPAPAGQAGPAVQSHVRGGLVTGPDAGPVTGSVRDGLDGVPLLDGVATATRHAIQARGVGLDVAAGADVTRRWDADRFFYLILAGRFDVIIDSRLVRTLGPGDHFGELAARDWGGGYGYARLATVRCTEPGRLVRLTSEDLRWLTDTEPAVKARLAMAEADRLRNR